MQGHMNPDYPRRRGCWIDTRSEEKVVLYDYPTWREKNEPKSLPPYWNRNDAISGEGWKKEFASLPECEEFMKVENYVRCDMPASLRERKPAQKKAEDRSDWNF